MMSLEPIGSCRLRTTGSASRPASLLKQKLGSAPESARALAHQLDARVKVLSGPQGTTVSVTHATFARMPQATWKAADPLPSSVHGHAWTASNRRASAGNGSRLAGSNVDAADKPKHDDSDQYQAENAAESRSAIPTITVVATEASEQQDHQNDN
jgi:hypothetical protein